MKKIIFLSAFVIAIIFTSNSNTFSNLNSANSDSTEVCLVSGEAIEDGGVTYIYLNKEVKMCCEGCEAKFKKNPSKYLGAAGLWCSVCDEGDAKESISAVSGGVKYYFCGNGCKKKFSADPDSYLSNYKK